VAIKTVAGQVPIYVNVSLPGTDEVIELARHAESTGAAAVIVITPYHWAPSGPALVYHFERVGNAVDIGLIAYNFPAKLGVSVDTAVVVELLARIENFIGIKDADLNMEYFTEVCRITSERRAGFGVYTGVEYLLPSMVLGGAGAFSAVGAVAPRLVRDLYTACAAGEYGRALGLQRSFSRLWKLLQPGYPATIKAAMELQGRPAGSTRSPIPPLTDAERSALRGELEAWGVLETEPSGWTAVAQVS
jgi:4-hydroxy-tetrahydrodipicolinate synthase